MEIKDELHIHTGIINLVRVKIIYLQVKKKSRHVASFFFKLRGRGQTHPKKSWQAKKGKVKTS